MSGSAVKAGQHEFDSQNPQSGKGGVGRWRDGLGVKSAYRYMRYMALSKEMNTMSQGVTKWGVVWTGSSQLPEGSLPGPIQS